MLVLRSQATHSPAGRHLAEVILDELEHELRLRGRLQRLTVSMLRETQDACSAGRASATETGPGRHATGEATPRASRAIAEGVRRFFED